MEDAYELAKSLVNVPGGAIVRAIRGGEDDTSFPRKTAPQVNAHLAEFLAAHASTSVSCIDDSDDDDDDLIAPFARHGSVPIAPPGPTFSMDKAECAARFRRALWLLSELAGQPEIKKRNPLSIFSFSRVSEEAKKIKWER